MSTTRTNTATWVESRARWQINVQKDGVRRTFTSSTPGKSGQLAANAKADTFLMSGVVSRGQRISALWTRYVAYLDARQSNSSIAKVKVYGSNYILPLLGTRKIDTITEGDLQSVIDKAYKHGSFKKDNRQRKPQDLPLSRKTLDGLRSEILSFFKYCRTMERVTTLFPETLTTPRAARLKGKNVLQPQNLQVLFSVDTTVLRGNRVFDDYIYAYRFQVLTGLRPGELVGVQYGDIKGNLLQVRRSVNTLGEETSGKNENAIRNIQLTPQAIEACQNQKGLLKRQGIALHYNTPLFQITCQGTYYGCWTRFLQSNGCAHISLYEMRHTFVSVTKTLPEGIIRPVVGHSRNMDTYGVYSHLLAGEATDTAQQIGAAFDKIINAKKA